MAGSSKRPHHTRGGTAYASGWPRGHGATSMKTKPRACPTWTPALSTRAHFATRGRRMHGRRAEKTRAQSHALGTQGVGGSAAGHLRAGHRPFGGAPPPPQPGMKGVGRWRWGHPDVRASLAERTAVAHR
jgi:hypothetical protein